MSRRIGLAVALGALLAPLALLAPQLVAAPSFVGPNHPAGAVTTYATPAALAAAPTAGLTAGATASVTNVGSYSYTPTCPTTCDGVLRCVTAAGGDGGLGCWVVPQAARTCAQTAWTISPGSGSDSAAGTSGAPLATMQEWSRRVSGCTINMQSVVSITGSAAINGDWPTIPNIGARGFLSLDCEPGATTLYTSTVSGLTGVSLQSGNAPNVVTDTAANFTTACGGTSCTGLRFRVTTGALAGTIAWIVTSTATTLTLSDPELDLFIAAPSTRPIPPMGTTLLASETLLVGTRYVIEQLALINVPQWPTSISGDQSIDNGKLLIHSCASSITVQHPQYDQLVDSTTAVPDYGTPNVVVFIGSYPGFVFGTFAAAASLWDDYGWALFSGHNAYCFGCALLGDSRPNGAAFYQSTVIQENCGSPVCPFAGGTSSNELGITSLNGLGILGGSMTIQPGSTIYSAGGAKMWGNGLAGVCAHVQSNAALVSATANTCGDAGATNVAGTVETWAQAVDGGGISVHAAYYGPVN